MKTLFFVTSDEHAQLTADDLETSIPLQEAGYEVEPLVWSSCIPSELSPDAILIMRSAWDYHLRAAEFAQWLTAVSQSGIRMFNSVELMRWNLDKAYLIDLIERRVDVIPTELVRQSSRETLTDIMTRNAWSSVVIKPCISASAHRTTRVRGAGDLAKGEGDFQSLKQTGDLIVQPYLSEVITSGEWSLMFFCGEFSHAVVKKPARGDFRVQAEHGGVSRAATPTHKILKSARRAMAALPEVPLYARIDGVEASGRFLLMEAECIDPFLFFSLNPDAPRMFARCLSTVLAIRATSDNHQELQRT
jgi:glutathione synthase/RimK-type ligase-like ATP-grasp enzyme